MSLPPLALSLKTLKVVSTSGQAGLDIGCSELCCVLPLRVSAGWYQVL